MTQRTQRRVEVFTRRQEGYRVPQTDMRVFIETKNDSSICSPKDAPSEVCHQGVSPSGPLKQGQERSQAL